MDKDKAHILVVDDDTRLRSLLQRFLRENGFYVSTAKDAAEARERLTEYKFDLLIVDIMMPNETGLAFLEKFRAESNLPVIMLTAMGETADRITGLSAGADDYLPKPFEPDELICRVRAMLRRGGTYQPTVLAFGDVTLDPGSGVLSCCGQSVRLSGREFQVMELFLRSPQVVLSADRIMERVWGWDSEAEINVVWVHISNLRKKLRSIGSHVTIRASRGLGYLLEVEV